MDQKNMDIKLSGNLTTERPQQRKKKKKNRKCESAIPDIPD